MKKEAVNWAGELAIIHATSKDTDGKYCMVELYATKEGAPPLHVHRNEDEGFFVIDGAFTITIGDQKHSVKSGDYVLASKNIPHTYEVVSEGHARIMMICSPPGFEDFVRATSTPATSLVPPPPGSGNESDELKMMEIAKQFGIEFI